MHAHKYLLITNYERKPGYSCIMCATGRAAGELLAHLLAPLPHTPPQ